MRLADVDSWPEALQEYLRSQHATHLRVCEQTTEAVLDLLQGEVLRGWHCTRLTDKEVDHIKKHGMQPPNREILRQRIQQIQEDGLIDSVTAERFMTENQANDRGRKDRIWFCFSTPRTAGQKGIERFFRRWGGEALYNSHERDASCQ